MAGTLGQLPGAVILGAALLWLLIPILRLRRTRESPERMRDFGWFADIFKF